MHYRRKKTAIFWFYRFRQKRTANSRYRQKVPPTLNTGNSRYRPKGTTKTEYRPKGTAGTSYRPKGTADAGYCPKSTAYTPERYRAHWIPPKNCRLLFLVRSLFFVLSGSSGSFSVEPLRGRLYREKPPHLPIHLPPHLPTPPSAWSSRTVSGLEGNPSATSSGATGSATCNSSVEAGSVLRQPLVRTIWWMGVGRWCCKPQAGLKPRSAAAKQAHYGKRS